MLSHSMSNKNLNIMKNNKKKIVFTILAVSVFALAACSEDRPGKSSSSSLSSSRPQSSTSAVQLPKYNVVIKGADGNQISSSSIELRNPIPKPADPTAPQGQVFYGWKNTKNGGQIWDFEADHKLNQVMGDVELVPVFVPADQNVQLFEAELVPEITEANGGTGLDGATYSGGAKGKQLIGRDYDRYMGSTCVSNYEYYEVYANEAAVLDEEIESYADLFEAIPSGKIKVKKEVDVPYGAYVHFNYNKGNVLTWKLQSDKAASNVVLFARFSAEYGKPFVGEGFEDTIDSFNDEDFQIVVNGTEMEYGQISIHNIEGTSGATFIYCQDYMMSASINLLAGENTIQMVVNNNKTLNGTIAASAPVIDSIKLYSDSTITWPTAKYTNLIRE